ncbi:MAG: helix-turn-helix domain-containing protein [Synergistaceae bacterium]|nr:helix-turn-helix domain-containing protein [Synergistaceae bacterium]
MFRKKAGITQIDLADELGISIATLRRWEAGETAPTGTRITELAKILKVEPEDIVSTSPEAKPRMAMPVNNGMLIFENGGTRIELPPTERGYEVFNHLVENMIKRERETQK